MGEIGNIWVRLGADVSNFEKNMSAAEKAMVKVGDRFQKIGKELSIAGAAITASMGLIIIKTANLGDEFYDLSQRTGIAVETLSSFKLAADKSGTSIGGFATGMKGLSRVMFEAASGGKEAQAAFKSVGVSATDSAGNLRPLDQVMLDVADKFAQMDDGAEKSALAMKLFGKSGMDLIPMFNLGRKGLEENVEQMKKFGVVTLEEARAGDAFNDAMTDMQAATGGLTRVIGNALIPTLTDLATKVADSIAKVTAWAKEHPLLIKVISGTVLVIGGLLTALGSLSYAFGTVLKHLPTLITGFKTIAALASKAIVFTFAIAGAAIIAATIAKMIEDFKKLREAGATTAEALRSQFLNFNPFKSMSREGLGKFLTDMDAARDKSISVKGAMILLGEAFRAIKGSIEGGTASLLNFGEALKTLGIKTKTELTAELKAAEDALKAFRSSAEATPGQVKALEDKIVALKEAMSGTKSATVELTDTFAPMGRGVAFVRDVMQGFAGELTTTFTPAARDMTLIMAAAPGAFNEAGNAASGLELVFKAIGDAIGVSAATVVVSMYNIRAAVLSSMGIIVPLLEMPEVPGKVKSTMDEVSTVVADAMRNIASAIVGAFNLKGLFGAAPKTMTFDSSYYDQMIAAATSAYEKSKALIESNVDALRATTEKEISLIRDKYDDMVDSARKAYDAENLVRSRAQEDADTRLSRHEAEQDRIYNARYEREKRAIEKSTMTEHEKNVALLKLKKKFEADERAREIAREDAKVVRERKREDAKLARELAQELKIEGIRTAGALAEQAARDAAVVKEQEFLANLLGLQNQHQLDLDQIRKDEDTARQKQADDEEKRQNSLWTNVKGIFATACENMVTIFLTKMFEPLGTLIGDLAKKFIDDLLPSAKKVVDSVKDIGKGVSDAGTTAGSMASSFLSAAGSIASIVTAVVSIIDLLSPAKKQTDVTYWLKLQKDLLQDSYNFYIGELTWKLDSIRDNIEKELKPKLWIIANAIDNEIKQASWAISGATQKSRDYLKTATSYLKTIASVIQNIKPAAAGYSGIVQTPTLFMAGERGTERVQITPTRQGNTQPAIYIRPVVIPRGDKYIIEFLTDAMRHGQMRVPTGAVGGA